MTPFTRLDDIARRNRRGFRVDLAVAALATSLLAVLAVSLPL
jgi:hypothetical protein